MKFKRILAAFIACLMLAAVIPVSASGTRTQKPLTQSQKAAKLSRLVEFNEAVIRTEAKYPISLDARSSDPYATGRIIVKYHGSLDTKGALACVSGYNDWNVLWYATPGEARAAAEAYRSMKGVEWAEPDIIMTVEATPGNSTFRSWGFGQSYVNAFDMNEWLYARYGNNVANIPEVIVAVVDTGCDQTHSFLSGRTVQGYDVIDGDNTPTDAHSHGTHVSGTVVDGTLANVKVMPIKVLGDDGYGTTLSVCTGIEYGYLHGAKVENCSLGGFCDADDGESHHMMSDVINAAFDNGTVVCVAAGNETDDAINHCPANVARACTVAATTQSNSLAYFSNFGPMVDLAAPGDNISSCIPGGSYGTKSGTSMASPHAAAVAAMIKSAFPEISADAAVEIMKGATKSIGVSNAGTGLLCVTNLFRYDEYVNAEGGSLHFYCGTSYPWAVENGVCASGNAGVNNSTSAMTCDTVIGELASVTFEYKVSSEEGADFLRLKSNGAVVFQASGETGWQSATVELNAENPTLVWEFYKNASGASGSDKAWIRSVRVTRTLSEAANLYPGDTPFTTSGAYPWVSDEIERAAKSGNAGVHNSASEMNTSVELIKGMKLVFEYKVSCRTGDKLTVKINESDVLTSGATDGFVQFVWIAPATGSYDLRFIYSKDASGSSGSDCAWIRFFDHYHTFDSAANGSDYHLPFENDEEYPWFAKNDYVCSGNPGEDSSVSSLYLTLDMLAGETLTFLYAVSSESNYDFFRFYINDSETLKLSGSVAWTEYTFTASANGTYVFQWSYSKDSSVDSGEDCGKLKGVVYSGAAAVPNGDANGDGVADAADALLILRWSMGLVDEADIDLIMSDVDGNGTVDASDALIVFRIAMGLM